MKKRDIAGIAVVVVAGLVFVVTANLAEQEAKAKNPKAIELGFTDYKEMEKAMALGISNGADWSAKFAKDRQTAAAVEAARYEATRNPATKMSLDLVSWSISGFGTVAVVTVAINNANDFPIKDVGIECRFSAKSGTELSTATHTIFDTVKAKSKRTFKEVNVGFINSQSTRAGCSVETAKRA